MRCCGHEDVRYLCWPETMKTGAVITMHIHIPPPLIAAAAGLIQKALMSKGRSPSSASKAGAAAVAVSSVGMIGASAVTFYRHRTTISPLSVHRATTLVTGGPFRISRNPMYVGLAGVLTAYALLYRSPRAALPLVGFVVLMNRSQIAAEEAALQQKFGAEFTEYCGTVPRWIFGRQ